MRYIVGIEPADFSGRDGARVCGSRIYFRDASERPGLVGYAYGSVWIPSKYVPSDIVCGDGINIYYTRSGKPCKIEVIRGAETV